MTAVFERVQLVQMINTDSDLGVHSASDQAKQLGREWVQPIIITTQSETQFIVQQNAELKGWVDPGMQPMT